jgi:predicted nucleotidyltransferase
MKKIIPEIIAKEINLFRTAVISQMPVKKVFLFGSWTKNLGNYWSDIDIAVISNGFSSMEHHERIIFLLNIARISKCKRIDPQGYTPLEMLERNSKFMDEIAGGLEIYSQQD